MHDTTETAARNKVKCTCMYTQKYTIDINRCRSYPSPSQVCFPILFSIMIEPESRQLADNSILSFLCQCEFKLAHVIISILPVRRRTILSCCSYLELHVTL